jgi:hypothetical protein
MPNELLGGEMFQAVLQQAQLKGEYESYTTELGPKLVGEVVINLFNASVAEWCVRHFHGCCWVNNIMVEAQFLNKPPCPEQDLAFGAWVEDASPDLSLDAWPEVGDLEFADCQAASLFGLEPAAAFHLPQMQGDGDETLAEGQLTDAVVSADIERPSIALSIDAPAFVPAFAVPVALSAEAPVFVPGNMTEKDKLAITSDASTADGESEVDSEKEGGVEVAA